MLCPCSSGDAFAACCEPYLTRAALAPTAEALMRARYSACATGNTEFMFDTDASAREEDRPQLVRNSSENEWLNLIIREKKKGRAEDGVGFVTFVAVYRPKPTALNPEPEVLHLHERSTFKKQDGAWIYTLGAQLPAYRLGRNEKCWCGSGKKFKQCCG